MSAMGPVGAHCTVKTHAFGSMPRSIVIVMLAGVIADAGMVHCHCQRCNDEAVTFSEFEAHADAKAGRPGDTIVLSDCGATLRVSRRRRPVL